MFLNMAFSRKRLENMRADPRAALTVISDGDTVDHVSLLGTIVSIEPDPDLSGIDRLALRYDGVPFGRRDQERLERLVPADALAYLALAANALVEDYPAVQALRDRNFRLLFAGRAISYIGTYLAPIAVAFAVLDLSGSATEVGLSFAAWTLAQVATLAFGGVIGDRLPRRIVMIASDSRASPSARDGLLLVTRSRADLGADRPAGLRRRNRRVLQPRVLRARARDRAAPRSCSGRTAISRSRASRRSRSARRPAARSSRPSAPAPRSSSTAGRTPRARCSSRSCAWTSLVRAGAGFIHELREGWSAFVEHTVGPDPLVWISLYFLITYAPFFVLGPDVSNIR